MYRLTINGAYRGNFKIPAEAMAYVEKHARPFKHNWEIKDPFRKVYAQG